MNKPVGPKSTDPSLPQGQTPPAKPNTIGGHIVQKRNALPPGVQTALKITAIALLAAAVIAAMVFTGGAAFIVAVIVAHPFIAVGIGAGLITFAVACAIASAHLKKQENKLIDANQTDLNLSQALDTDANLAYHQQLSFFKDTCKDLQNGKSNEWITTINKGIKADATLDNYVQKLMDSPLEELDSKDRDLLNYLLRQHDIRFSENPKQP